MIKQLLGEVEHDIVNYPKTKVCVICLMIMIGDDYDVNNSDGYDSDLWFASLLQSWIVHGV